jgi:hypothetical protein
VILPFVLGAPLSAAIVVLRAPDANDCPDGARFTGAVERIVGRPLGGAGPDVAVRVEFSRSSGAYEATVRISGAREGERTLRDEGPTCEALGEAVAVATALLVDVPEREAAHPAPASEPRAGVAVWLSGRGGAGAGLVGGLTWTAGGSIEATIGPLMSIELGAGFAGAQRSDLGSGGVRVSLWYAELGAYRSFTGERVRVGPCVRFLGGARSGAGEGYPLASSASLAWWAVGAGVQAETSVGASVRVGARAFALLPARKQSFSIGYVGTAYESSPIAAVAEFAVAVKFW